MRHVLRPGRLPPFRQRPRAGAAHHRPLRLSDLILALLGVTLLGGLALAAVLRLAA